MEAGRARFSSKNLVLKHGKHHTCTPMPLLLLGHCTVAYSTYSLLNWAGERNHSMEDKETIL